MKESRKFLSVCFYIVLSIRFLYAQNPGDNFFGSDKIHIVTITFKDPDYWNTLLNNYKFNQSSDSNLYTEGDVLIDSLQIKKTGIRLKGNSTYSHPGTKKPLKLSFNEFVPGQKLDGLTQLNLHNGFLDPTMMREKLVLDFLNANGLPAPRCTYAAVYFDSSYVGLYKAVEEVDKKFLKTHYSTNDGNLYKGDPNGTLEWNGGSQRDYYDNYELKTNEPENVWDDLMNLIHTVNFTSREDFKRNLDGVLNTEKTIQAWAANNLFANLDAYYNSSHNYYLYHNSMTGKFEWISWDVGTSFGVYPFWSIKTAIEIDPVFITGQGNNRPLCQHIFEIEDYKSIFFNSYCEYLQNGFTPENLFPKIDSIAGRISAYMNSEPESNRMYSVNEFEGNLGYGDLKKTWYSLPGLKSFVMKRREYLVNRLCELEWSCTGGVNLNDYKEKVVTIYPNPAVTQITVQVDFIEKETPVIDYSMVDILGREVYRESETVSGSTFSKTLNVQPLEKGLYILYMHSGCRRVSRRVVVY